MRIKVMTFVMVLITIALTGCTKGFTLSSQANLSINIDPNEEQVVLTAMELFAKDYNQVFNADLVSNNDAQLFVGTLGRNSQAEKAIDKATISELSKYEEGFVIQVKDEKLYILGSDKRGTAFGILELSRLIGVSPWEWWADSPIATKESFTLINGFKMLESPSVARRGIFLNDEDWGLMPWSSLTYEPSEVKGEIGPNTHARIFELLLRLRANTFWPAMHDCSVAFYLTPGNKEMADKYGIFVGTSHCEPMVRNTNAEWNKEERGSYNYLTNREGILEFWRERVTELAKSDNIYTLGLRGEHDSKMLGANSIEEQKTVLIDVLKEQREMIANHVNPNVEEVSQVFIPYKEILDVYNEGLNVPEDVCLMWCDDNYGYIRHFPTQEEKARKGGNGVYYHISYWGRPHDYLWLSTNHPAQLYTQMKLAYDKGAKDMWVLNVGDIKPSEYLIELFLDMAWDIEGIENNEKGLTKHLETWITREFGKKNAKDLVTIMNEYYRLAYIRKPEFMGNTRTEEKDPVYRTVTDLPWSENYILQRIEAYKVIADKVIETSKQIPADKQDAWFQLIEYPVRGAAEMNFKHLYAQLARHGKAEWSQSNAAYDNIVSLTDKYGTLNNGKWNRMMDYRPRKLAVFDRIPQTEATAPMVEEKKMIQVINGTEYVSSQGGKPIAHGLGYERKAITLPLNGKVGYSIKGGATDSVLIEVSLAPNHPVNGETLRYSIAIEGEDTQVIDFRTHSRSEEWKVNTLRNQAIRTTKHAIKGKGKKMLTIQALDEGVIIDQIKVMETK